MSTVPDDQRDWRMSIYSDGGNGDCVEVAFDPETVGVRDSKNRTGPKLTFPPTVWQTFTRTLA